MTKRIVKSDDEWKSELTPEEYRIIREKGTEPPFTGEYCDAKDPGVYRCRACGTPLFSSNTKYDSRSGWPSFYEPVAGENVRAEEDRGNGMRRTEVLCAACDAHLGHVFPDGPKPTGLRYCINSASLELDKDMSPGAGRWKGRRRVRALRSAYAVLAAGSVVALSACAPRASSPSAGSSRGYVPNLMGAQVMVLPVQAIRGVTGDAEAELVYALNARGRGVRWLMPQTLRAQLARNPALDVPLDNLPVGVFLQAQVDRVGDPLYGYLRRLSAISNGTVVLIPVEIRHRATTPERPGAVEVVTALVDVGSGRVAWFGVVQGEAGDGSSPGALASAVDALARVLFPMGG